MLEARDIHFAYRPEAPILSGVSLALAPGELIGLSGASGGGKSTLGRIMAGYLHPGRGSVTSGESMSGWSPVQYLHQSSIFAVDPRWRIGRIVEEGWQPDEATRQALGISRAWYDRYPHEISGGELQRVTLLRALSPQTRYLIADEITAMLDPITQADIWRLLLARCEAGLGILAISHDAPLLARVATRTVTMQSGKLL
ncbi:ABC-type dipeptide/oligopeptide/nickel transport system, ATPase component [Devosia sp. YR412]|uniref:ABC transporter ATP-binding protein n=1 Tax=Devosia sp. YR412 TaxID=1881030 RepID=UPI0008C7F0D7|nr:ATP-binding cassette domain-containing protein [Devosia sp. YR412]SEQ62585.1 ABC-type dipeptide/oligopeptide/nickel transport system, ATPase component [Devosia sp. YR412]